MNLYELQREINLKRQYQNADRIKIKQLRDLMLPHSSKPSEIKVDGYGPKKDNADIIHAIVELEKNIDKLEQEIKDYMPIVIEIEKILKETNDRDRLIYMEHYLKGYSANKIGMRYSLTDSMVYKILKKVGEDCKIPKYSSEGLL